MPQRVSPHLPPARVPVVLSSWSQRRSALLAIAMQNSANTFTVDDGTSVLDAHGFKVPFSVDVNIEIGSVSHK